MRPEQWDLFKRAARLEKLPEVPLALIIDSPWIPGYLGIQHMDFYLDPELWFQSHLKIHREFPDIIFVPGWWMEYGMAAEPSALGAKIKFWKDNTPSEYHTLYRIEDMESFPEYEVENDAFMALTLHRIRMQRQRILDTGEILPFVTSRGPMCTAGFVRSTTELMFDLVERPEWAHKLLDLCTRLIIDWLKAQQQAMGDTVEGIFILDDIVGFVNEDHYKEFCHPYLKRICDAFPKDWVKLYHNDAEVQACLDHLPDCGFNLLNWGKQTDYAEVKARVGHRMCLMGNVNPLEVGVRGTPEEVRAATLDVLEKSGGEGIILSVGGGTSPGMPKANIVAMQQALAEFNGRKHLPSAARGDAAMPDYALMNQCLYEGKAKEVEQMTRDALAEGRSVKEVLTEGLIAGMSVVGEDFKYNVLYVPEVLIAARAMKAGMAVLKPLLSAKDSDVQPAGVLVMGTVRGDLHDIGKNLVCMMAEGAGFQVYDIGVDQSLEKFLVAYETHKPNIIGMSALLTTTMTYMKTVIDGFEQRGLGHIKFAIGGAPITQGYADEIGADGYGADASSAVDLFLHFVGQGLPPSFKNKLEAAAPVKAEREAQVVRAANAKAKFQILYWQDIPSELKVWDDFDELKISLPARFSELIDISAQRQGLIQADAYMAHLRWSEPQERSGTPSEVAAALQQELQAKHAVT